MMPSSRRRRTAAMISALTDARPGSKRVAVIQRTDAGLRRITAARCCITLHLRRKLPNRIDHRSFSAPPPVAIERKTAPGVRASTQTFDDRDRRSRKIVMRLVAWQCSPGQEGIMRIKAALSVIASLLPPPCSARPAMAASHRAAATASRSRTRQAGGIDQGLCQRRQRQRDHRRRAAYWDATWTYRNNFYAVRWTRPRQPIPGWPRTCDR